MSKIAPPDTLLDIVVRDVSGEMPLLGVHAGYESSVWRADHLAHDLVRWAPDWILSRQEIEDIGSHNAVDLIAKALNKVYTTEKYENRGEIGELLLHIVLRTFYGSERAISRIFFKDAANDTVKGFDAAHVVINDDDGLELWLGESKFYPDVARAASDVLQELLSHLEAGYLRSEFIAIVDKLEPDWEHTRAITELLHKRRSLDSVFSQIVIPVFITYNSSATSSHSEYSDAYLKDVEAELRERFQKFVTKHRDASLPRAVRLEIILLPMATKKHLTAAFDKRLKSWQSLLQH